MEALRAPADCGPRAALTLRGIASQPAREGTPRRAAVNGGKHSKQRHLTVSDKNKEAPTYVGARFLGNRSGGAGASSG
jgi:hypothetical protein